MVILCEAGYPGYSYPGSYPGGDFRVQILREARERLEPPMLDRVVPPRDGSSRPKVYKMKNVKVCYCSEICCRFLAARGVAS